MLFRLSAYSLSSPLVCKALMPDSTALESFYGRLGFERSGGKFEGSPVMVRSPR